jgi:purine-nucleoside phosphorylase
MYKEILESAKYIQSRHAFQPEVGIILGSGLGGLINEIKIEATIPYPDIPHFVIPTVEFHSGELILGYLGGTRVVVMHGRFHYYEGYSLSQITFPVRVMKVMGIQKLYVSNAAGGLNPDYQISDLMILNDHINLLPDNPLRGPNIDEMGGRFPDMSEPYDRELITAAKEIAIEDNIKVHEGVYAAVSGPNLETRAEYRYLRIIGADAIGMSTIPENIVARHMGISCFAISVITDLCIPETLKEAKVDDILAAAYKAEPQMTRLMARLINRKQ